jgi:hypothetical protein
MEVYMANEFSDGRVEPAREEILPKTPSVLGSEGTQLADLKEKVVEDFNAAATTAKEGAAAAMVKAKDVVSEQANFAARQIGGIATALKKVGSELEGSDQFEIGRYAGQIGSTVENFAKRIEGRDLGEVATMAEDFGRKQPLAFLGIAALAGLAASRFLTASATRPANEKSRETPEAAKFDVLKSGGNANG